MQESLSQKPLASALLILIAGITVVALYSGLSGNNDLIPQIPLYLHVLDSNYLPNDSYVQEASGLSVRTFPVYIISALAYVVGLDAALLLQYLFAVVLIIAAVWIIVRHVFGASELTACIAIAFILLVPAPALGNNMGPLEGGTIPRGTAKALALLGIALWLHGRGAFAALSISLSALFQPAYGLWLAAAISAVWIAENTSKRLLVQAVVAVVVVISALTVLGGLEAVIMGDASDLVFIVAKFRNPHHMYIFFDYPLNWLRVFLLFGIGLGLLVWLKRFYQGLPAARMLTLFLSMFAVILAGFVLLELLSTRLGLSIQSGRHFYVIYFLSVIAGTLAVDRFIEKNAPGFAVKVRAVWSRWEESAAKLRLPLLAVFISAAMIFAPLIPGWPARLGAAVGYTPHILQDVINAGEKKLSDTAALALAARALPENSVLLAPPDFGLIRIVAQRALYVDYKSWPFSKPHGWFQRMTDAYGPITLPGGDKWVRRANRVWAQTPCAELKSRAQKLGVSHVVIDGDTNGCGTPVISSGRYKILTVR